MAKRIVVLLSGSGSNLQAIIDQVHQTNVPAEIVAVISNRPNVKGLERAQKAGIPALTLDHKSFTSREDFDQALKGMIDEHNPDLVVLAGFMRILTPEFVEHYHGRMLNIHPSLLPDYKGINTHQRVIGDGKTEHGVSVHFVTAELDGGPVVKQARVPVYADDTADKLAARVLVQEHIIYPEVITWFVAERLTLESNQPLLDNQPLAS